MDGCNQSFESEVGKGQKAGSAGYSVGVILVGLLIMKIKIAIVALPSAFGHWHFACSDQPDGKKRSSLWRVLVCC